MSNLHHLAVRLVRDSSLQDFGSALDWAQWCREIAMAAMDGDTDRLKSEMSLAGMEEE